MVKFSKGDKVWMIRNWDGKGTFAYAEMTVESFGKCQATLRYTTGSMAKQAFFVDDLNSTKKFYGSQGTFLFPITADAEAEAMILSARWIADQIEFFVEHRLNHPAYDNANTVATLERLRGTSPKAIARP